jgi:excisionase family DNA binding protein
MTKKLLNIHEAAEYLGLKVSTLYAWVHQRRVPYVKVGRLVRFRPEALEKWLENNTVDGWRDSRDGRKW